MLSSAFPELEGFRFDPQNHLYFLDRARIPSVTGALRDAGVSDPLWYTEEARELGKAGHAVCHYLDDGDLDWRTVDPRLVSKVRAYQKFKEEAGFEVIHAERKLYHPTLRFAGTFDRLGLFRDGRLALLDLKFGEVEPWIDLQTAGYELLVRAWPDYFDLEGRKVVRLGLQLKDDETWRATWCRDPHDAGTFRACLAVANWKNTRGK